MRLQWPDDFLSAMGGSASLPRMEIDWRQRIYLADNGLQDGKTPCITPTGEDFSGFLVGQGSGKTLLEVTRQVDQPQFGC